MAQDYDHLTLMQKVEVFEHALEHTQGDDLARILWYKSPSSEVSSRLWAHTVEIVFISLLGKNIYENCLGLILCGNPVYEDVIQIFQ